MLLRYREDGQTLRKAGRFDAELERNPGATKSGCARRCDGLYKFVVLGELSRCARSVAWDWRGNGSDLCFAAMRVEK